MDETLTVGAWWVKRIPWSFIGRQFQMSKPKKRNTVLYKIIERGNEWFIPKLHGIGEKRFTGLQITRH